MLTLAELNDLPEITWGDTDFDASRVTLSDFQHGKGYVDYSVRYEYSTPDGHDIPSQTLHLRIADVPGSGWTLFLLDSPHGAADRSGLFPLLIDDAVIRRIRSVPSAFVGRCPSRRFVTAFYNQEI